MDKRELIKEYWKHVANQDRENLRKFFLPEAEIYWHCTNEKFTLDEYITVNCDYPGSWHGKVEKVVEDKEHIITVTRVWDETNSFHAVSFFKINGEKISSLEEYWADDTPPPSWRSKMNLGTEIKNEN